MGRWFYAGVPENASTGSLAKPAVFFVISGRGTLAPPTETEVGSRFKPANSYIPFLFSHCKNKSVVLTTELLP